MIFPPISNADFNQICSVWVECRDGKLYGHRREELLNPVVCVTSSMIQRLVEVSMT